MKTSIEISMYPLREDYELSIVDFIRRIHGEEGIDILTNGMSTQLVGDYDHLMAVLTREMKRSLEQDGTTVMVLKILNVAVGLGPVPAGA